MKFQKDGPKRLRYTRRELPHGQVRRWGSTVTHFKRERIAKLVSIEDRELGDRSPARRRDGGERFA